MNFLKTTDIGGFPFVLDDLRWAESGYVAAITAMLKAYRPKAQAAIYGIQPPDSFIVYGCEYGGNPSTGVTYTAGIVMIDGVLYSVAAGTSATYNPFTQALYFIRSVAYDPAGSKQFQNNVLPTDTYGIRRATPTIMALGQTELALGPESSRYMSDIQQGDLFLTMVGGGGSSPAYGSNWQANPVSPLQFRKNPLRKVEFIGCADRITASGGMSTVFRLPVGYRPEQLISFIVPNMNTAGYNIVQIGTDGYVNVFGAFAAGDIIDMSVVQFWAYS